MTGHKESFVVFIHNLQNIICNALEKADGKTTFVEDEWIREEGGGGKTRIIQDGAVFEKGGVNTSVVHGTLPEIMKQNLNVQHSGFFACGISLVLHPHNPFVPTVHANFRYFELYDDANNLVDCWFGGGSDLTPYYLFEEDVVHFHTAFKKVCDKFDNTLYPKYKSACDKYFFNHHRNEARGVGGLFFDYLRANEQHDSEFWFNFTTNTGNEFLDAYLPIVEKRKDLPYSEKNKYWQEIRRGRYVEFNLIHDKGTLFGLKTNGRIESILMSLPPTVRWDYNYLPERGSEEEKLLNALMHPKDWLP
jgi:coproporphyrinogen III oxidase